MNKTSQFKPSDGALAALAALHRSAAEARKIAIQTNTGIVIRRDGKLVELSAADLIAEAVAKTAAE
ncbi:hypothetical protein [Elstera litoralis]|uniref:hypothetical protein n=1 Tax=Elstera litoralis TaxID=552518 RepID=UPI0005F33D27|nr:hypothetical protein [Elstera litoralis]